MSRRLPLLLLLLLPAAHAQTSTPAADIRAGRAALEAGEPQRARLSFSAALAQPGNREDSFAAAIGLGRASLWLGDYPAAARAFGMAREQAGDVAERQLADSGLAQALNAQDYPRKAYALVAPFAEGQTAPTLELLRAMQALGWQDKSPAYLAAAAPPPSTGHAGTQYRLLRDDMRYALAPRVEGSFGLSHDSEDLDTWYAGLSWRSAPHTDARGVQEWGVALGSTRVDDRQRQRRLDEATLLGQWRLTDEHRLDLRLGLGRSGGWQYLQGAADWTWRSSDSFSLSAGAERAPLLTDAAIGRRLVGDTYSLAASLRPAAYWYVIPTYYRQTFSDGNHRDGGTLRVLLSPRDVPGSAAAIGAQLSARVFHASRPSRGVYFNPARYHAVQAGLVGVYGLGAGWKLRATADIGRQSIDGAGAGIYGWEASLEGRLPHNGRLQFRLGRTSAASESSGGAGYWNNSLMLSVGYPL